nr:Galectin domain containing protein [Haemonchus contortus]
MAAPQRFPLPNMPFRREVHSGCAIGTSISCTAQAFKAKEKSFTIQMATAKDIAVIVNVPIAKRGNVSIRAQIDGKYTSDSEASIFVPMDTKFSMKLHITPNVTELYYNDTHLLDYVHRVSPAEIREVFIEGPLIVEEVVFTPPQGSLLDPLPSYDQATSSSASIPLADMQRLSLGKPGASSSSLTTKPTPAPVPSPFAVLIPTPGPPQIGLSSAIVNNPMPGVPLPSQPADVLDKTPELPQNRSPSNSVSWNPFEQSSSTNKPPIYENIPSYTPTAFQQAQSTSSSSTPTPYRVVLPPNTPYSTQSSIQPLQPQSFTAQPMQPYQVQPYPTGSQTTITPYPSTQAQILPQQTYNPTPIAQVIPAPQPYNAQYPYPAQNPYVHPNPYPQAVPGMQMQPPYNAYQQAAPYQYPVQQGPYASGYAPQYYGNYPVMYGSGCHYRRSSSCCSD